LLQYRLYLIFYLLAGRRNKAMLPHFTIGIEEEFQMGTEADRQIALYEQTSSMDDVIRLLMKQTMQGIPVKVPA